jgi:protein involved in polysaccharide export with SLBB domain
MESHPAYTVAPPDVLLIDVIRAVPRGPYRLEPLEALQIAVTGTLPNQPIAGTFMISPEGTINLGFNYGSVRIGGMTLEEAEVAVRSHLNKILKGPMVTLGLIQFRNIQQIAGQHLVRPDGTISLGRYGSVYVAGFTLGQIKCELEHCLAAYLVNPQVSVDILSYNSKKHCPRTPPAALVKLQPPMVVAGMPTEAPGAPPKSMSPAPTPMGTPPMGTPPMAPIPPIDQIETLPRPTAPVQGPVIPGMTRLDVRNQ